MRFVRFALPLALSACPAFAQQPPTSPSTESRAQGSSIAGEILTGVEYRQGDYFTGQRVEILSIQNAARLRSGRTVFSAAIPWHRIDSPGNIVGGGAFLGLPILVDPTQPAARERRQGIGDLELGLGHSLPSIAGFELAVNGKVKLPTASARRGIGTGETDFGLGAELARPIGRVTPYVAVGYLLPGSPDAYELRNSLSARAGLGLQLGETVNANFGYGYAQSPSSNVPDEQLLSTGVNAALSRSLSLGVYGNAGLSSGSPDVSAGVSIAFRIF